MAMQWPERLLLVRHGESLGNLADLDAHKRGAGRLTLDARDADVELSPTGLRQAKAVGTWLAARPADQQPTVVLCSPYRRAEMTAETAVRESALDIPLHRDERLRERDLGMFDGMTSMGIRDQFPEEAERRTRTGKFYYRPPGGESWVDVVLRIRSLLRTVREEYGDERIMIASHQAVIMNFRYVLEGLTEAELMEIDAGQPLANCSLTSYVRTDEGTLELDRYNDCEAVEAMSQPVTEEDDRDDEA